MLKRFAQNLHATSTQAKRSSGASPPLFPHPSSPARPYAAMVLDSGDTAWMLTSTAFVLFMTLPGLAMFYGGLVRSTSVLSVFMQCFTISCVASLIWLSCGYSLAFGDGGQLNYLIGNFEKAFAVGIAPETESGTIPETVFIMFQMTFAIITPALIAGAYPERIKFSACTIFSALWLLVVYVPVCHWVWGGGFLAKMGVMDFAGGIVVHCTAGWSALVFAAVLGPRLKEHIRPPHQPVMTLAGAAMLWVGWFGFNAGSALTAGSSAGMAMLVTHTAAAAASLAWVTAEWMQTGQPTSVGIVTGTIAGLAAVTPASGFIGPMGGLLLGTLSGFLCEIMTKVVKETWKIDDSIDVFAVHGVGGMLGSIMVSFLAHPAVQGLGLYEDTMLYHLKVQTIAVIAVSAWSVFATYVLLKLLEKSIGIRVPKHEEAAGLDMSSLGERAYSQLEAKDGMSA